MSNPIISLIGDAVGEYYENRHYYPNNIVIHPRLYGQIFQLLPPDFLGSIDGIARVRTIKVDGAKLNIFRSYDIDENEVKVF